MKKISYVKLFFSGSELELLYTDPVRVTTSRSVNQRLFNLLNAKVATI